MADWGVAWFGSGTTNGVCARCGKSGKVYQGYNGGAHINKFCGACKVPVLNKR